MKTVFACVFMALAAVALAPNRRGWAYAMQAEYVIADEHGEGVSFALGCLWSAWRELPHRPEGQLALARYMLTIGVMLPAAGVVFASPIIGYPFVQHPYAYKIEAMARHLTGLPMLNDGNASSLPFLFAIVAVLACCNTAAAWCAADQRWIGLSDAAPSGGEPRYAGNSGERDDQGQNLRRHAIDGNARADIFRRSARWPAPDPRHRCGRSSRMRCALTVPGGDFSLFVELRCAGTRMLDQLNGNSVGSYKPPFSGSDYAAKSKGGYGLKGSLYYGGLRRIRSNLPTSDLTFASVLQFNLIGYLPMQALVPRAAWADKLQLLIEPRSCSTRGNG